MLHLIYWLLQARLTISVVQISITVEPLGHTEGCVFSGGSFFLFLSVFGVIFSCEASWIKEHATLGTKSFPPSQAALHWTYTILELRTFKSAHRERESKHYLYFSQSQQWGCSHMTEGACCQKLIRVRPCARWVAPQLASQKPTKGNML